MPKTLKTVFATERGQEYKVINSEIVMEPSTIAFTSLSLKDLKFMQDVIKGDNCNVCKHRINNDIKECKECALHFTFESKFKPLYT